MNELEIAKEFFMKDKYAMVTTGIDILEIGDYYAKTVLEISDKILNGVGKVMGGAIFTLADFTFAVSSNRLNEKGEVIEQAVTSTSSITYLNASKGTKLFAKSRLIKNGARTCCYEISITDDLGNQVAVVLTNGIKI